MPAPKKIFKKLEGGGRGMLSTGGAARKAVVKVKPKPNTKAEPKSNVATRKGGMSPKERKWENTYSTKITKDAKSGKAAKDTANTIKKFNKLNPNLKTETKKIK